MILELLTQAPPVELAPDPPSDMEVRGKTSEYIFFASQVLAAVLTLAYGVWATMKGKTLIPVMCVVGGAMMILTEPLIDAQLQVWWPEGHQPTILDIWGREVPLMILFTVTFYFGLNAAMRYRWLEKHGRECKIWTLYAIEVACALALEPPAIQLDLWHYYGEQGFKLFGYPVYWPFIGGACCMAAGTLIYLLREYLTGLRVLLVPPILVIAASAAYWGAGWPMFLVLNAESSDWLVYPASAASIGLAFLIVWMCTIATGHRDYRIQVRVERQAAVATEVGDERTGSLVAPTTRLDPDPA